MGTLRIFNKIVAFPCIGGNCAARCNIVKDEWSNEYAEQSNTTSRRTQPICFCSFDFSMAIATIVLPYLLMMLLRRRPEIKLVIARWPKYDAQDLYQFPDDSFDVVFSLQVNEHIPKPWIAAKEINRVLKTVGIGIHTHLRLQPQTRSGRFQWLLPAFARWISNYFRRWHYC